MKLSCDEIYNALLNAWLSKEQIKKEIKKKAHDYRGYISKERNLFLVAKDHIHIIEQELYKELDRKIYLIILYRLFDLKNFWPTLTAQLAILIYITASLDSKNTKKILQKNIRIICNCSTYAFHRKKNCLEIKNLIEKHIKLEMVN